MGRIPPYEQPDGKVASESELLDAVEFTDFDPADCLSDAITTLDNLELLRLAITDPCEFGHRLGAAYISEVRGNSVIESKLNEMGLEAA